MGKRSRKRDAGTAVTRARPQDGAAKPSPSAPAARRPAAAPAPAPHARPLGRKARMAEAPPAPWSPFPLVELCILAGLVLLVVGFVAGGDHRLTLLVLGFALVAMSSAELSVREHFAGYRSHTTLLSAAIAIVPMMVLRLATGLPQVAILILGAVIFFVAFILLRAAFARQAGGYGFRA